jgi:PIN domain nuclease of toxin-antitoxin system
VILLDTHVLLWLDAASNRLGPKALTAIDEAFQASEAAVSAITFWEVGTLIRKNRIRLRMDLAAWRSDFLDQGLREFAVTGEIGIRAAALRGFNGDPADRLIAATAELNAPTLLTADAKILDSRLNATTVDAGA